MSTKNNYLINPEWVKFQDVKDMTPEEYFNGNGLSINSFKNKYILPELGEKNPAEVMWRVSSYIATPEKDTSVEAYEYWRCKWFHEMFTGWWMAAGSIMQGAANPKKVSLSNCTTIGFGIDGKSGDNLESIFDTAYTVAKVAAFRQGLGVHFDLRPQGMPVHNSSKESLGNTHWMKYINEIGNYIGQKGRIPAMLFSINCKNPDFPNFINIKSDQTTIANANISVHFTNEFMDLLDKVVQKKLPEDTKWVMEYKTDAGDVLKTEKPILELFNAFVKNNWAFAEPGAQFVDIAKEYSNSDYLGDDRFKIKSTNACSEQYLEYAGKDISAGLCVLSSANFYRLPRDLKEAKKVLRYEIAPSITRFLDNTVEMEIRDKRYPIKGQLNSLKALRRIGAGVTNLDGWLIRNGIGYDTKEGISAITGLVDEFNAGLYETSIQLGAEKGNFGLFDEKNYIKSPFVKQMSERHGMKFKTMRNVCVGSVAPTGTLSSMFNTIYTELISYGFEPIMAFYYWKRERTSGKYVWTFNVPRIVREILLEKGIDIGMTSDSIVENEQGNLGESIAKVIDANFPKDRFKPAHEINPFRKVELMGNLTRQSVDSSISITYNLPEDVTEETIRDVYIYAWKNKVKSIAIYRDKSRVGIVEFVPPRIAEQRFATTTQAKESTPVKKSVKRPEVLNCDVHHISVKGEKWIAFVGTFEQRPYEIFAGKQESISLPKKYSNGVLLKDKKLKAYMFESGTDDDLIRVNVTKSFTNDEHSALTRQISLSMRHGVPLKFVIDQLDKSHGTIIDFSKTITRVLKNYLTEDDVVGMKCKECGSSNLVWAEKCPKCLDCGSDKCS